MMLQIFKYYALAERFIQNQIFGLVTYYWSIPKNIYTSYDLSIKHNRMRAGLTRFIVLLLAPDDWWKYTQHTLFDERKSQLSTCI